MSAHGVVTLIQHLCSTESVMAMALEGLDPEVVPSEDLRKVYVWAIDYYHKSGREKAPSIEAMKAEWGDLLASEEIAIEEEPESTIQWAMEDLRAAYAHHEGQEYVKSLAMKLAEADTDKKVQVLSDGADELMRITFRLESKATRVALRDGVQQQIDLYDERAKDPGEIRGLRFGLPEIDQYTRGIHDGEVAIIASGPKIGKSFFSAFTALHGEWAAGRRPILYTLENSVEMTMERMVSIATHLSGRGWQRGHAGTNEEIEAQLAPFFAMTQAAENDLMVIQPDLGQRSIEYMVRDALLRGADSIIIDQLSFVELPNPRRQKYERIGDALHMLKAMISTGPRRVPVVLLHQINRDGVEAARKEGRLRMEHLAESAEVERTADWVFGIYRSDNQKKAYLATLDTLAARREDTKSWELSWHMDDGAIRVIRESHFQ